MGIYTAFWLGSLVRRAKCAKKKTSSNIQLPDVFRRGEKFFFRTFVIDKILPTALTLKSYTRSYYTQLRSKLAKVLRSTGIFSCKVV